MFLATVLQLSFRVLTISYSLGHLSVEQQFFFHILREFFAMRCNVERSGTGMRECESDDLTDLVTLTSHMAPGKEKVKLGPKFDILLRGVLTFVVSVLDIYRCTVI